MSDRLQTLQELLAESPDDSFLIFAIAKEYEKRLEGDHALDQYLQLRKKDPNYVGLYYHLGKLYERREDWTMALQTYREGMEVARRVGDPHALSELAGAKMNLEEE